MKIDTSKAQKRKFVEIIKSPSFNKSLNKLCKLISFETGKVDNEASVVSIFEIELFGFIKNSLGLRYYPNKEKAVNTVRHISKGRIDSKVGALVIEFKHQRTLSSKKQQEAASAQLIEYLNGLYKKNALDYLGLITDGRKCKFIRMEAGDIYEEMFENIQPYHLSNVIKAILFLEQKALSSENLIKDFCKPSENNISRRLTINLYKSLKTNPTGRSLMLFNEWKELFSLAHDDISKQKTIEERRAALSAVVGSRFDGNDDEYLALYALQTTYAIIIKIIAYKVISKVRFNKSLIEFETLAESSHDTLRHQMNSLEEGAIFRSLGIGNLLEGDFFAWYCSKKQWNKEIAKDIQKIFTLLTRYEDKAIFESTDKAQDLFKDLFITIMPDKVRSSLGEFYTPPWLADNLVSDTLDYIDNESWTALDPCAGSGTFVTVLIRKVLADTVGKSDYERLQEVLARVKAIDLNPLAVLTSRINYFINVSPLIGDSDSFEIPVYLGDASYVAENTIISGVPCLSYKIKTIKGYIDIDIPQSAVSDPQLFSRTMTSIEEDIRNGNASEIVNKLLSITNKSDRIKAIKDNIESLSNKFIELEKNDWNGIWARIVTNFLTTANLGKFDLIVGNPPWIDWKNLPTGYRDRIKALCISRHLFSGDSITGGINLNICALISNVVAQNWLKENGTLAFLMPQTLIFQQTYEGFRVFELDDKKYLYFQKMYDWTKSGHPFAPVQHKFLTFFINSTVQKYSNGIPLKHFIKKPKHQLATYAGEMEFEKVRSVFEVKDGIVGQAHENSTIFSYAEDRSELRDFGRISGESFYIGREGIEFYPQELFLLMIDEDMPTLEEKLYLKNYQNKKSKYKIPQNTIILEKKYLHPLVKGVNIERFHLSAPEYIVPFPYDVENYRSPIDIKSLTKKSPLLAKYLNQFRAVIESQTNYNEKIIGAKHNTEYYALARVGKYSFARNYVAFRDNTKWQACVVTEMTTEWGGLKRPLFQNHAVSISETKEGRYISLDEAHYVCAILNAPLIARFLINSSDSRSFKIRPPIYIPEFNKDNLIHDELVALSKEAHLNYADEDKMHEIDIKLNKFVTKLKDSV